MRNERFDSALDSILAGDTRYPRDAYHLLSAALDHTIRAVYAERRSAGDGPEDRHISGRQLAEGFRDYLLGEYGPFARYILEDLRLRTTDDIGNLVFNLVAVGAFGKSENDKRSDFHDLYDFHETFVEPFLCEHE